jgi:hypothetical protein
MGRMPIRSRMKKDAFARVGGFASSMVILSDVSVADHRQFRSVACSQIHLTRRHLFCSRRSIMPNPPLSFGLVTCGHEIKQCPPE